MNDILDSAIEENVRLVYAGFWIRVAAIFIDIIIIWAVNFAVVFLFRGAIGSSISAIYGIQGISSLLGIAYYTLMESSHYQGTLGKLAVGIKVGDSLGHQISWPNALGRYFSKIISALILGIGFMMAGWDEKKQALHDKIADTYVFYA